MQPIFDSAHVTTYKNQKRFDSQRVIEIFMLVVNPSHNAFITALPKPLCTTKDIEQAIEANEQAERYIESERQQVERRINRQSDLEQMAKNLKNRFLMKNTNNSKVYLLPEDFKPQSQYTNAYGLKSLKISADLRYKIASECSHIGNDTFVFESVTRWNCHSIIDQVSQIEISEDKESV